MPSIFLEEIPTDDDLWAVLHDELLGVMRPLWRGWFIAGAAAAEAEMRRGRKAFEDPEELNAAADAFIANFENAWWARLRESQQSVLRAGIELARAEGWQPRQLAKWLAPQFGRERASRIAVTELTRLVGGGAQAAYRAEGYATWEWRTAEDKRVDEICRQRAGEEFPITTPFEPAHPNCRCWPVPGELLPAFA